LACIVFKLPSASTRQLFLAPRLLGDMASAEECGSRSPRALKDHAGDKKTDSSQSESSPCKGSKPPASDSAVTRKQINSIPTPSRKNFQRERPPATPREKIKISPRPQQQSPSSPCEAVMVSPVRASAKPPPEPVPSEPVSSPIRTRRPGTPFPVWVHVYDLGHISKYLVNSWARNTRDGNCLGIFHVGVEVLNVEFCFQAMSDCAEDDDITGLTWHNPKSHPRHVYRESICLGNSALNPYQVGKLLERLEKEWQARMYNCLTKNCVDFADLFVRLLGAPRAFPKWTHGLAKNLARRDMVPPTPAVRLLPCSWSSSSDSQSVSRLGSVGRHAEEEDAIFKAGEAPRQAQSCSLFGLL